MKNDNSLFQNISPEKLKEIKAKILAKREALKKKIKKDHPEAYEWLVKNNIDLNNLQKYSKNIAMALALTYQVASAPPQIVPTPAPPKTVREEARKDLDLESLSDEEKVKLVWEKYGEIINKTADKYRIDSQLIFATIMTESEGDPQAYRYEPGIGDASYGLGQILYTTALNLGFEGSPEEMYDPKVNIDLVGKYHKDTIETYGQLAPEQMTVVYNTGKLFGYPYPGHLERFRKWYYTYSGENRLKKFAYNIQ